MICIHTTCIQVYGSANCTSIAKLQKIINFAARVISGRRKYDQISDIIDQLGWLSAPQYVAYFDLSLMHSVLITDKPVALRSALTYNHELVARETRQSNHLALPARVRNNHGKRRYQYRAVQQYNELVISRDLSGLSQRLFKANIREVIRKT